MTHSTTIRAFVAAMLPKHVRGELVTLSRDFATELGGAERALRWARPEGLHLTFHFERELPKELISALGRAMGAAAAQETAFALYVSGIGAFPNEQRPRVIWAGVGGDLDRLNRLAQSVKREVKAIGLRPDTAFKAHLTLARVRDGATSEDMAAIASLLHNWQGRNDVETAFTVDELTLVESRLDPGGSIYTPLGKASLQRAEG